MGKAVNFPPFVAGKPLLDQLTADRMNAIEDAINRLQVVFGDNVTGFRTPGGVIVRASAEADSTSQKHPFKVTKATRADPPENGFAVYPGFISTKMATIGETPLTATPFPILNTSSSTGAFSIFLRVEIEGFSDATFGGGELSVKRYSVKTVKVLTDDQTGEDADYDEEGEVIEFKVKWEDAETKELGRFFIKVADVAAPPEGSEAGVTGGVTQILFVSYRSILISEEVIVALP